VKARIVVLDDERRMVDIIGMVLRRAVVYGSTLGSFAVERFSIDRLMEIQRVDIARRLEGFRRLVAFEEELGE
jgi:hypothetical protein